MGKKQLIEGMSPNLKKAICWISETVREHPAKKRHAIIEEAELRFDLNPRECEFLSSNFNKLPAACSD